MCCLGQFFFLDSRHNFTFNADNTVIYCFAPASAMAFAYLQLVFNKSTGTALSTSTCLVSTGQQNVYIFFLSAARSAASKDIVTRNGHQTELVSIFKYLWLQNNTFYLIILCETTFLPKLFMVLCCTQMPLLTVFTCWTERIMGL